MKFTTFLAFSCIALSSFAQNYIIQQSQQNVSINVPVIEKKVYIERYHPVYIEKPRQARKLEKPETLLGYLCVFPEDIGCYSSHPTEIINNINQRNLYGRNTWRIPTHDELMLMVANADLLGMSDEIYMATTHANGNLRLVSTEATKNPEDGLQIGTLMWNAKNFGARQIDNMGALVKNSEIKDLVSIQPLGWRIPTIVEFKQLLMNMQYLLIVKEKLFLCDVKPYTTDDIFTIPLETGLYSNFRTGVYGSCIFWVKKNDWYKPIKIKYSTPINNITLETQEQFYMILKLDYNRIEIDDDIRIDEGYVRCVKNL